MPSTDHRGHGIVLSDDDRQLLDRALDFYSDGSGDTDECDELRRHLWNAW